MEPVQAGDIVHVHYVGKLEDGTVFDSSDGGEPLEFVAGGDDLLGGMARQVVGMRPGERRTVTLAPAEAYGAYRPELKATVQRTQIPADAKVGDELTGQADGREFRVRVTALDAQSATLDANHPLAGRTLTFDLELQCVHPRGA
jgi:peptidylprolyl isomerase